ncbi:MAG: RND transporter [Geobacteraceae bacterium GWC2_58_44]|nr:MAG: RND transporter [Geobacteraceae bacterium GWC2_58_44]
MKRTTKVTAAMTLCLALGPAASLLAQQPPIELTLKEAIRLGFERNLDLKVELYNPALAEAEIRRSLGIYDPLLSLGAGYDRSTSTNTFNFTPIRVDQYSVSAGVSQLMPTGAIVGATANSSKVSSTTNYYTSGVNFSVSQPLLRNFGREVNELEIAVFRYGKEGSLERFRTRLSDTVAQVRNEYFRLYNLREALEVKKTSLALANRILDETRGRVRAGVLPAMEILNAEFGSATREKEVIDAERAVRDQMDVLRLVLQLDPARDIVIVDEPSKEGLSVVEEEALALALRNRPELAAQRVNIKIDELQQRVAKNRTLPDLTVDANLGVGGFDPRFAGGLERTAKGEDPNWGIGVNLSYPIGNRAAKNEYLRSRLAVEQAQTQLQSLEAGIAREVKAAIRLVASSYKQLDVTSRGRAYAEDRLRAFQKRNAVGLATTKDVFDVENDLVTAKGSQIQAVVDYNNAITQLWRVTGEILDRQGIRVSENQADALVRP